MLPTYEKHFLYHVTVYVLILGIVELLEKQTFYTRHTTFKTLKLH